MQSSGNRTMSLSATWSRTRITSEALASGLATEVRIEAQVTRTKPNRFMKPTRRLNRPAPTTGLIGRKPRDRPIDRLSHPRVEKNTSGFNGFELRRQATPRAAFNPQNLPIESATISCQSMRSFGIDHVQVQPATWCRPAAGVGRPHRQRANPARPHRDPARAPAFRQPRHSPADRTDPRGGYQAYQGRARS